MTPLKLEKSKLETRNPKFAKLVGTTCFFSARYQLRTSQRKKELAPV